jgi:hypothetical protein
MATKIGNTICDSPQNFSSRGRIGRPEGYVARTSRPSSSSDTPAAALQKFPAFGRGWLGSGADGQRPVPIPAHLPWATDDRSVRTALG